MVRSFTRTSEKSRRQSQPTKTARRYGFEGLEARELMAGNVDITLQSGNLLLTGDNLGNGVQVRQISDNKFAIVGIKQAGANTTINGAGFQIVSGVTGNVTFNMNGGNDQIDITDGVGFFASQPGLPTVYEPVTFAKSVNVNLGDGADLLAAEEMTVKGQLNIDGGFGNAADTIRLDGVDVQVSGIKGGQALEIDTNGGNDVIDIEFSRFNGSVDIDTGTEDDFVQMFFVEVENLGDLQIRAQAGDDEVALFDLAIADDLLIDAGNDEDLVTLVEVEAQDDINVQLGFGADTLQIFQLIGDEVELDGGGNIDTLLDAGENLARELDLDSFEIVEDVSE
jgi:hypothetical protein